MKPLRDGYRTANSSSMRQLKPGRTFSPFNSPVLCSQPPVPSARKIWTSVRIDHPDERHFGPEIIHDADDDFTGRIVRRQDFDREVRRDVEPPFRQSAVDQSTTANEGNVGLSHPVWLVSENPCVAALGFQHLPQVLSLAVRVEFPGQPDGNLARPRPRVFLHRLAVDQLESLFGESLELLGGEPHLR
jgi:hypothetical protein